MKKIKLNFKKIMSLTLVVLLLVQTIVPLGGILDFVGQPQTAFADSSTTTNASYATISGKMSTDGKSIVWTITTNSAQAYHSGGMYNYFYPGDGLGAPTNVTMNGSSTTLTAYNGYYYKSLGYVSGKYTYQVTTAITDPNRTSYTFSVEDTNYTTRMALATATVDNNITSVQVDKVWNDAPATKPSVTFDLYASNVTGVYKSYTMASGTTSYTFAGLPKTDASGNPITYSVKERPVTGYTQTSKQNSATSWTFTNSNQVGSITAQKTWLNIPAGTTKPTPSFTLKNLTTGQTWTNATYNATSGLATFSNIPKVDANGKPYSFQITETPISGYYTTYSKNDVYGTKWTVTNNYQGTSTTTCPIPMGVTSVTNSNFYPFSTTKDGMTFIGFNIDVSGTWSVPSTAKAGDTFTLQLPKEISIQGGGQTFYLKAADGSIAGTGTMDSKTNLVTFTLSSYVDSHTNIGGTFDLKGLQANYNTVPTAGTYNLNYTAKYSNLDSCTRTYTNTAKMDYINKDGTSYLNMFDWGIKAVQSETATSITWKVTVRGDQIRAGGYTGSSITLSDTFDAYQKWATNATADVKIYQTDVYDNNGYNTATMTEVKPTITSRTNGFSVSLPISSNQDYVVLVTT